jgi:hypothetical protein
VKRCLTSAEKRVFVPFQNAIALTKCVLDYRNNESELPESVSEYRINAIAVRENVVELPNRVLERCNNEVETSKRALELSNPGRRARGVLKNASEIDGFT